MGKGKTLAGVPLRKKGEIKSSKKLGVNIESRQYTRQSKLRGERGEEEKVQRSP